MEIRVKTVECHVPKLESGIFKKVVRLKEVPDESNLGMMPGDVVVSNPSHSKSLVELGNGTKITATWDKNGHNVLSIEKLGEKETELVDDARMEFWGDSITFIRHRVLQSVSTDGSISVWVLKGNDKIASNTEISDKRNGEIKAFKTTRRKNFWGKEKEKEEQVPVICVNGIYKLMGDNEYHPVYVSPIIQPSVLRKQFVN